jgi:hypothetical protein
MNQKPCRTTKKPINFVTHIYVMPLYYHTNQGNFHLMIYMNFEELQKKSFNLFMSFGFSKKTFEL